MVGQLELRNELVKVVGEGNHSDSELDAPEPVNNTPYGDGGLINGKPAALTQDLTDLLHEPSKGLDTE